MGFGPKPLDLRFGFSVPTSAIETKQTPTVKPKPKPKSQTLIKNDLSVSGSLLIWKRNRFLEECEGVCQNGDGNRRRTLTKWCVSERWNINFIDIKILNEPKDAHYKTEQHGTFDSCCTSSIVHKNLKGSVVALEGTARNCKIKSYAWL
jgi:hypothetical protein